MNPRKLVALAVLAAAAALPSAAHATTPVQCTSGTPATRDASADPGPYTATRVSVCTQGTGYIEAGFATTTSTGVPQVYVVASGDVGGYAGVSSFDSTGESANGNRPPCIIASPDGNEGGSGSNAGGCYGTNLNRVDLTALSGIVPLPVCGDDTGPFYNTSRNGCRADNEDIDQAVAQAQSAANCILATPTDIVNCILSNFP